MGGIPIATVKDANRVLVLWGEAAEEADEATFIVDLYVMSAWHCLGDVRHIP